MSEAQETTLPEELAHALLTEAQHLYYRNRIADLQEAAMDLEMVGSPADVSNAIGNFQFLRGKIETYKELLNDHFELTEALKGRK